MSPPAEPCWEAVVVCDDDGVTPIGARVRWSEGDGAGRYLWVGHYLAGPTVSLAWCRHAAGRHAARLNAEKKAPWEYAAWREAARARRA